MHWTNLLLMLYCVLQAQDVRSSMHFVRIGKKALNLDSVSYCEAQIWQDEMSLKVYFAGSANNTPLVFAEEDAKELWKYLDYVAEKPV